MNLLIAVRQPRGECFPWQRQFPVPCSSSPPSDVEKSEQVVVDRCSVVAINGEIHGVVVSD